MSNQQELAPKEQQLFNQLQRAFDRSEYTKGIKTADQILATKPENGETLAMKGICIHSLVDNSGMKETKEHYTKEQAFELVRQALRFDMSSPVCWHSLAMLNRTDHLYPEAIKAYKMASLKDPKSTNILRDMSSVAAQLRDWDTFLDCRQKMLGLKSDIRQSWVGVGVAHYLRKDYELAAVILDVMCSIMDAGEDKHEAAEVHYFRCELALLSNKPNVCLSILSENEKILTNPVTKLLLKARAFSATGAKEKAVDAYQELLKLNLHEADCIFGIAKMKGIKLDAQHKLPVNAAETKKFCDLLDELQKLVPKLDYAARLMLDACPLDQFKEKALAYTTPFISKNIPSLFSVMKSLYQREPERVNLLGEVFLEYEKDLMSGNCTRFGKDFNPTFILWVWTFLASHYSRTGDHAKAHEYIGKAINHSPTCEMLYLHRAKIHRREGKIEEAAEDADLARKLDLQDKYLNSKAAKYILRVGNVDKAEETMALFFKHKESPHNDHYLHIFNDQNLWYEREAGRAFFHKGDYYQALQCLLLLEVHRKEDSREMLDFHNWAIRKVKLRAWLEFVSRPAGAVPTDKNLLRAAPLIVRSYVKVHEMGEEAVMAAHSPRPDISKPTDDAEADRIREKRIEDYVLKVDLSKPLEKATWYVEALRANRPYDAITHEVAFEYHQAKGQPLGCVRALTHLKKYATAATYSAYLEKFKAFEAKEGKSWEGPIQSTISATNL